MLRLLKLPALLALAICAPFAIAQRTLGEVLDAGGKVISAEEFEAEIAQRIVVGPTPAGGHLEILYGTNGVLSGTGTIPYASARLVDKAEVSGVWTIDAAGKVCTTARFRVEGGGPGPAQLNFLPPRCQVWLRVGDQYFLSDSDSDRSTKVFSRSVKQ